VPDCPIEEFCSWRHGNIRGVTWLLRFEILMALLVKIPVLSSMMLCGLVDYILDELAVSIFSRGPQIFQTPRSHLKILGTRWMT
jgi:hypothetical protein